MEDIIINRSDIKTRKKIQQQKPAKIKNNTYIIKGYICFKN